MPSRSIILSNNVFINCPFDLNHDPIFRAIIFTIYACDFVPRSARELDDGSQTRIDKLYTLIEESRFGIHDLSRTELDPNFGLPRFNMPLELGIFLGAKRFGGAPHKTKRVLILDTEPYRYQRFVSDLAGMDIQAHGGDPAKAIRRTRDWLANVSRRVLPSGEKLTNGFKRFMASVPETARETEFDPAHISYVDFERMVASWLLEANAAGL